MVTARQSLALWGTAVLSDPTFKRLQRPRKMCTSFKPLYISLAACVKCRARWINASLKRFLGFSAWTGASTARVAARLSPRRQQDSSPVCQSWNCLVYNLGEQNRVSLPQHCAHQACSLSGLLETRGWTLQCHWNLFYLCFFRAMWVISREIVALIWISESASKEC